MPELAKGLKGFQIQPHSIRPDEDKTKTPKGYYRRDFADAWARFLPSPEKPPQAPQPPQANKIGLLQTTGSDTKEQRVRLRPQQNERPPIAGDTDTEPPQGEEPPHKKACEINVVADVAAVAVPRRGSTQRELRLAFGEIEGTV
jgi:hypothetical protein